MSEPRRFFCLCLFVFVFVFNMFLYERSNVFFYCFFAPVSGGGFYLSFALHPFLLFFCACFRGVFFFFLSFCRGGFCVALFYWRRFLEAGGGGRGRGLVRVMVGIAVAQTVGKTLRAVRTIPHQCPSIAHARQIDHDLPTSR